MLHTKCYTGVTFLGWISEKHTVKLNLYSLPHNPVNPDFDNPLPKYLHTHPNIFVENLR